MRLGKYIINHGYIYRLHRGINFRDDWKECPDGDSQIVHFEKRKKLFPFGWLNVFVSVLVAPFKVPIMVKTTRYKFRNWILYKEIKSIGVCDEHDTRKTNWIRHNSRSLGDQITLQSLIFRGCNVFYNPSPKK